MRAAVVDLDGTVLVGDSLIPGADEGVEALREAGLGVLFLTNNPTQPPAEWAERLTDLGVPADPADVLTSAAATRAYLDEQYAGAPAFPIANAAVVDQLRAADVTFTDDSTDADVVVAGFDTDFDYWDMTAGLRGLRAGADLVGTDPDPWVPTDGGPIPGSGAVVNAIAGAAETEPTAVLGKPSRETVDLALARIGVAADECLLVGDRLTTDIAMGERAGMATAVVRTGATDDTALAAADVAPDHVLDSLADVDSVLRPP